MALENETPCLDFLDALGKASERKIIGYPVPEVAADRLVDEFGDSCTAELIEGIGAGAQWPFWKSIAASLYLFRAGDKAAVAPLRQLAASADDPRVKEMANAVADHLESKPPAEVSIADFAVASEGIQTGGEKASFAAAPAVKIGKNKNEVENGGTVTFRWAITGDFTKVTLTPSGLADKTSVTVRAKPGDDAKGASVELAVRPPGTPGGVPCKVPFTLTVEAPGSKVTQTLIVVVHDTKWLDGQLGFTPLYGFDISEAKVDWLKLETYGTSRGHNVKFGYLEATVGISVLRADAKINWDAAAADSSDFIKGLYHFFTNENWKLQATHFIDSFKKITGSNSLKGMLPVMLDLEEEKPSATYLADAMEWVKMVRKALTPAADPVIYAMPWWWEAQGAKEPKMIAAFGAFPFCAANAVLFATHTQPDVPKGSGWSKWTFWQYREGMPANHEPISGITLVADHDIFNGELADLEALVIK